MSHFLDYTGLQEFWTKIKQWIAARFVDKTGDTMTGDLRAPAYYVGDTVNKTTSVTTDTDGTMFLESFVQGPHDETTYGSIIRLKADEINPHYRHHMNGQWGPWKKILVEGDAETSLITPIANGGTGASTAADARANLEVPHLGSDNYFTGSALYLKSLIADLSQADNGLSGNLYQIFGCIDKINRFLSYMQTWAGTNGGVSFTLGARNYGTGSAISNTMSLGVQNNGTKTVTLSDPAAWRDALGIGALREANGSSVQIASNTGVDTCSISLPAGLWLISGGIKYAANSTGERYLHLTKTSKATNNERVAAAITRASNSGASLMSITCPFNLTATTTIYLVGWQNSGSTISAAGYISAVKVG